MRGALTIAAREVRERAFVFVTMLIPALMPFVMVMSPNRGMDPREAIMVIGSVAACLITLALAILLGASVVGRDLADRRLSFYFSKPVSASAIWFGKIGGALATVAICFAIIFVPAFLAAHNQWRPTWGFSLPLAVSALLAGAVSLLLTAHGASTIIRSRSPLIALDVALLVAAGATAWWMIRPLLSAGALQLASRVSISVAFMVPLAILAGGAWQLSRGRADIRCSHRELSKFFWTVMILTIAVAGLFVAWVFAAGPRDIKIDSAGSNTTGDWLAISGPAEHRLDYRPVFLIDLKNGGSHRVPGSGYLNGSSFFGHRGDVLVTLSGDRDVENFIAHVYRLSPSFVELPVSVTTGTHASIVVSDDLTRLATFEFARGVLAVYDLPSRTLVGSAKLPSGGGEMFFVSDDVVRINSRDYRRLNGALQQDLRILEFNAKTRQVVQTGALTGLPSTTTMRVNADGSTMAVYHYGRGENRVRLLDARTAVERGTLTETGPLNITPLADGGIAYIASKTGAPVSLRVADNRGVVVHDVPLGAGGLGSVRELIPGRKYLAALLNGDRRESGAGWTLCVVDVQRGIVERIERNLGLRTQTRSYDPRLPAPNTSGDFVVADANNVLWRWNALTGAKSKIF